MALKDIKLTPSGDIAMDVNSRPTWIYDKEAVTQICDVGISLWKGNWFADPKRGVDWLGVFRLTYNRQALIGIIASALRKIKYVKDVVDVTIDVKNRVAQIAYTVKTDVGKVSGGGAA